MFIDITNLNNSKRQYTDEGYLVVPCRISRTGIQYYLASEMGLTDREPDEIISVYRPLEEVSDVESLRSFANKPVTNDHPYELLNSENFKNYVVGYSGSEVTMNGDFVETVLCIADAGAIKDVEEGKVELSNGYIAEIEWVEGTTPNGEHYHAIQRDIRGNHIAIVQRGRAGHSCRVSDENPKLGERKTMLVTIDSVEYDLDEKAAKAIVKIQKRLKDAEEEVEKKEDELEEMEKKEDELEEELKSKDEEMEEMKSTCDTLKAKVDDLKSRVQTKDTINKLVAEQMSLIDSVRKLDSEYKWEGKDAETIRREVVAAKCPNVQMDSVSKEYIRARFDMLVESIETNSQQYLDAAFQHNLTNQQKGDNRPAHVIAREKMIADSKNAWKKGE